MRIITSGRKAPEVERAASKDKSRPVLTHAYLDVEKSTLNATDSYMAVVLPVEVEEGDESGLIPAEALKAQRKAGLYASFTVNGDVRLKGPDSEQVWRKGEGAFPNLEMVTPQEFSSFKVGIDPSKLLELSKALGADKHIVLEFTLQSGKTEGEDVGYFPGNLEPFRVTAPHGNGYGILMPVRIP